MPNSNRFWVKLLVPLGFVLLAFAVAWGVVGKTVNDHSKTIEKHDTAIGGIKEDVLIIKGDVKVLNVKQDVMQKSLDRIEEKL